MATETKPEKPMEEAKKKSKINAPPKLHPGSFKDGNFSDSTSCVSSVDAANTLKENDIDQEPISYYPVNYYGYYYPVSFAERDEQSYLVGSNEVPETHQTAFPAANPSILYYTPEFQTAYNPYSPYISGTYLTTDGQYLSQHLGQHGYYAGPNFPLVSGYSWDNQSYVYADGTNATLLGDYSPARVLANSLDMNAIVHTPKSVTKGYVPLTKQTKPGGFGVKENGQKNRNKLGAVDVDFLNEQNRGPRTGSQPDDTDVCHSISQDIVIKREDYNLADFLTNHEQAMFFVIKSYSEDDIHKSIKYNVWASTPNGNQRLDSAFQSAKSQKSTCPVFLFFSVNASGQFCGVAEMVDRVNFSKSMDFWQQDKWNGFFPVKWHIIKDVPNSHFRHIILENNDNKPVTNSRDTQEVKFSQGNEMLNIFKNFNAKTSILDDFSFYDNRQKAMQNRRIKVNAPNLEGITVKLADGAPVDHTAAEVAPLIAGFKGIDLGPAKSGGAVKE